MNDSCVHQSAHTPTPTTGDTERWQRDVQCRARRMGHDVATRAPCAAERIGALRRNQVVRCGIHSGRLFLEVAVLKPDKAGPLQSRYGGLPATG